MQEVKALGYTDKPDYAKLRGILQQGLKSIGATDDKKLDFGMSTNGAGQPSVKVRATFSTTSKSRPLSHSLIHGALKMLRQSLFEARCLKTSPFQHPIICLPFESRFKFENAHTRSKTNCSG